MKKYIMIIAAAAMVLGFTTDNASAANSLKQGEFALSYEVKSFEPPIISTVDSGAGDFVMIGRYFLLKDVSINAGFGFSIKGDDGKGTDIGFLIGGRKYLKTDDFAPFVGASFYYSSTCDSNVKAMIVDAVFGAEYFMHKQFSIDGSVGIGYGSAEVKVNNQKSKFSSIGTQRMGLSVNYYF
jgi:hypothetical protein